MDKIATVVEVDFLLPIRGAAGKTTERYNLFQAADIATWKANNKLSAACQVGLREVEFTEATEENINRLKEAAVQGDVMFRAMLKERGGV